MVILKILIKQIFESAKRQREKLKCVPFRVILEDLEGHGNIKLGDYERS